MTDEQIKERYEYYKMTFMDHSILEPWDKRGTEIHDTWKEEFERLRIAFVEAADAHHQATRDRMTKKYHELKRKTTTR